MKLVINTDRIIFLKIVICFKTNFQQERQEYHPFLAVSNQKFYIYYPLPRVTGLENVHIIFLLSYPKLVVILDYNYIKFLYF